MTRQEVRRPVDNRNFYLRLPRGVRLRITATALATIAATAAILPNAGRISNAFDSKPEPGCELVAPEYLLHDGGKVVEQETGLGMQDEQFTVLGLGFQLEGRGGLSDARNTEQQIEDMTPGINPGDIIPGETTLILTVAEGAGATALGYDVTSLPGHHVTCQ